MFWVLPFSSQETSSNALRQGTSHILWLDDRITFHKIVLNPINSTDPNSFAVQLS